MLSLHAQKKIVVFLIVAFVVGCLVFILVRNQFIAPPSTPEPTPPSSATPTAESKVITSTTCGMTFTMPSDWSLVGILGESKILSPEDMRQNEEWAAAHQNLIANEQGEAPLGPDARSLYISCQQDVKTYLGNFSGLPMFKDVTNAPHLSSAFVMNAFHVKDSGAALLKTMKIDGQDAYEISQTVRLPDGTTNTTYEIVMERGNVTEIQLGKTEYDNLPASVKQIIQSIAFVK